MPPATPPPTTPAAFKASAVTTGPPDPPRHYLEVLASRNRQVRVLRNDENRGFAAACNQDVAEASSALLVIVNNDTIVPPGWLSGLTAHLADPAIGLVGPTTNRCGGAAELPTSYGSYGDV